MDYIRIKITVRKGDADLLCARLSDIASGFEIDDPSVVEDFVNDKNSRWDYIEEGLYEAPSRDPSVSFYVEDDENGLATIEAARVALATVEGEYDLETERVRSSDWENNWKEFYKPFKVGERLYVRPSWENIDDSEGRAVLVMDPASSFGTGSHATTRLCMEVMDGMSLDGARVLDMGCGSGILGCCAMLLGADSLVYCDIDENAVRIAGENIEVNAIPKEKTQAVVGDVLKDRRPRGVIGENAPYDVILANIVSDVLIAMCPQLSGWLKKGGRLILSGIIDERACEVREHFERGSFSVLRTLSRDGWTLLEVTS